MKSVYKEQPITQHISQASVIPCSSYVQAVNSDKDYNQFPMKMLNLSLLLLLTLLSFSSCKKQKVNPSPCAGKVRQEADFVIKEHVGHRTFSADTVFRDNYVTFEAIGDFESVEWKIGDDPRKFTTEEVTLSFHQFLGTIDIYLKAFKKPDTKCFTDDDGVYELTKTLTVVEQFDKAFLTKSPLIGRYKGYNEGSPKDTFTVRVEYFDDEKYSTGTFGTHNFYWLSNLPKDFFWDGGSQAYGNPELHQGQQMDMGYKTFSVGTNTQCSAGTGWLSNDTLYVDYGIDAGNCKKRFIGIRQ